MTLFRINSAFTFSLTTRQCWFRFRSRFHSVGISGVCLFWCLQISSSFTRNGFTAVCTFNCPESTAWFCLKLLRVSLVTGFTFHILYPKRLCPHFSSRWHWLLKVNASFTFSIHCWWQVWVRPDLFFVLNALLCSLWFFPCWVFHFSFPPHAVIYASTCNEIVSTFQQLSHWRLQVRIRFIIRQVTAFVFFSLKLLLNKDTKLFSSSFFMSVHHYIALLILTGSHKADLG